MNIATRNGQIIVKDGQVAENCDCCGGWYCYQQCDCPCSYAGVLPETLYATLSFTTSGTLYGAAIGNFMQATVTTTSLSSGQAASVNGTYALTRLPSLPGTVSCVYEHRSSDQLVQVIRIAVGEANRTALTFAGRYACPLGQLSVSLDDILFYVPASARQDGYSGRINTICAGASFLRNASSHQHNGSTLLRFPERSPNEGWFCLGAAIYSDSLGVDLSESASEAPDCSSCLIDTIDHQWKLGIKYTDTSGASPSVVTYPKAITLRVFSQ
jgi:hypothetical protein